MGVGGDERNGFSVWLEPGLKGLAFCSMRGWYLAIV